MKLDIKTSILATAVAALLLAACQSGVDPVEMQEIAYQTEGDMRIALLSETGGLSQGHNQFRVGFRSAENGQPVDAGTVTVGSSMAMPAMAPMVAPIELTATGETGQYALEGEFAMSGAWQFEIRWDGPEGQGATSFNVSVR